MHDEHRLSHPSRANASLAALLTLCAIVGASASHAQDLGSPMPTLAPLIEKVAPTVVSIKVTPTPEALARAQRGRRGGGPPRQAPSPDEVFSVGSGVIVDAAQGYIVTNHHVVEDSGSITVSLLDNRGFAAEIVGSDAASDLALLKVDPRGLAQIALGNSDTLRVGDYVVAIGNPFNFSHTVTAGIVSGLGRSGMDRTAYESFIQTDAAINFGNSGGALVNLRGELVGINSAIISGDGGNVGVGFAIPVNMVRDVVEQLRAGGTVRRGFLGVGMSDISFERSRALGLNDMAGAEVSGAYWDTGARKAGLRADDVILAVNGRRVTDSGSLRATLGLLKPGDSAELTIVRGREERDVTVTLGSQPPVLVYGEPLAGDAVDKRLQGALIADNLATFPKPDAPAESFGVLIVRVEDGSPAEKSGFLAGDVILQVDGTVVASVASTGEPLRASSAPVEVLVRREGRNETITLESVEAASSAAGDAQRPRE